MDKKTKWTEGRLMRLLRARYGGNAWGLLEHVRNGTGFQKDARTIDAIAMSLWPSRGLHLHAFELKVSRGDWLRELKDPAKAEDIRRFCEFWWVVTAPGVVVPDEVPKTWGLLEVKGKALRAVVDAPEQPAEAPDRLFLGALFRKLVEGAAGADVIRKERAEAYEEGKTDGRDQNKRDLEYETEKRERAEAIVEEFEGKTGLSFRWDPPADVIQAVQMVLRGEHRRLKPQLERLKRELEGLLTSCGKALEAANAEIVAKSS